MNNDRALPARFGLLSVTINFECTRCHETFDCDVGRIGIDETTMRPLCEKDIVCPHCGRLSLNDVLLTELGQSQMTDATWDM